MINFMWHLLKQSEMNIIMRSKLYEKLRKSSCVGWTFYLHWIYEYFISLLSFSQCLKERLGHNEIRRPWWLMQILCSAFLLYLKLIRLCFYLGGCWTKYLSGYKYTIFKFDNTPVFSIFPKASEVGEYLDTWNAWI